MDRDPNIVDAGQGIHVVDTGYVRPRLAASHIVVDGDFAAIVDTGPAPAAPYVLDALNALGIAREQVEYLLLTHVHLDHAGGAGQLMAALPKRMRCCIHAAHRISSTRPS